MPPTDALSTDDEGRATAEVLIVGSGIAGCSAALAAARDGADVTLVTKASQPEEAATDWAQGGIATTRREPERLERDVLEASHGTADEDAVDVLVTDADDAVRDVLIDTLDVPFDVDGDGDDAGGGGDPERRSETGDDYDYAREAAHSEARILHVDAATGTHLLRPFLHHLDARDDVAIVEDAAVLDLMAHEGRVDGALVATDGAVVPVHAGATVLATGGIGAIYPRSTNPAGATGDGVAMAALAGADVDGMEYVQFHPTAYDPDVTDGTQDTFLVSEAVRGEGAVLRNGDGERFMPDVHEDAELAPRDVVARAVARERDRTGDVRLDVAPLDFAERFPGLAERCREHDVDWRDGIPVAPAEHFLCGGVSVDDRGRTSLEGLFAVGECARTGVHGANRLASTSLLEGLVWGLRAGAAAGGTEPLMIDHESPRDSDPALPDDFAEEKFVRLRRVMDEHVGLRRRDDGLQRALGTLRRLKGEVDAYVRTRTSRGLYELRHAVVTALLVTRAAAANERAVGCHHRIDAQDAGPDGGGNAAEIATGEPAETERGP